MLENKVAIVTGGSTGIGKATAAKYREYGAEVVIANRSADAGQEAAEEHSPIAEDLEPTCNRREKDPGRGSQEDIFPLFCLDRFDLGGGDDYCLFLFPISAAVGLGYVLRPG